MRKSKILAYIGLAVTPFAVACSVGSDNAVTYYVSGNMREEFKTNLTEKYWRNLDKETASDTKKNVLEALLKETGVGVTLSHISINSIWEGATKIVEPLTGSGVDLEGSALYDCQIELPEDLTEEEKKEIKTPNPQKCNEDNEEVQQYFNDKYNFKMNVTYIGSNYATDKIKKGEEVPFCANVVYVKTDDSIVANVTDLSDGKCQ